MTEWWQDLFDEKYVRLFAEARGPLQTIQEVEGLQALLAGQGIDAGGRVLDLACGWGRVTLPLARAGYRLTGADLSEYLLARAQAEAAAGLDVEWLRTDMRELPEAWAGRFDAVINVFSAFGYFEEPAQNQRVLEGVARVLRPGGVFIIDLAHRDGIMAAFRDTDWFEVDDLLICSSRQFDPIRGINTEYWLWTDEQGQRQSLYFRVHVYTATELTAMLRQAGLHPQAYYGALAAPPENYPFETFGRRLVIIARKPAEGS